jgi:DNA-binding protein H-NS
MYGANLKDMDVNALLELRGEVDRKLIEQERNLKRQLGLLGEGRRRPGRPAARTGRVSSLRGVKVAPKYRGPEGETWAGRGATPRWLAALIKQGHSMDDFAIAAKKNKPAKVGIRKRRRGRKS